MRDDRLDVVEMLRAADPVSTDAASELAESPSFRNRVAGARTCDGGTITAARPKIGWRHVRGRRRAAVYAVAAIALVLAVTPAFGVSYSFLPFLEAEKAPEQVQLDFARLQAGAPEGMDPRAITSETRKIFVSTFEGSQHTLWVAPTSGGGFCYEWTPAFGGCNASGEQRLSAIGAMAPVPGSSAAPPPPSSVTTVPDYDAMPLWIAGYAKGDVDKVVVNFEDGSTQELPVTWVGTPINAGFFAYDVPSAHETSVARAIAVDAVSADGTVLETQELK